MNVVNEQSRLFTLKKSLLVAFCSIDIVVYLIYASAARYFAEKFIKENNQTMQDYSENVEEAQSTTTRLIVIGSLLGISLQVSGLVGAIRESLILVSVFSISMTLGAIIALVRSVGNFPRHWPNTVWSVAIATVAALFLWDLYYRDQMRRLRTRAGQRSTRSTDDEARETEMKQLDKRKDGDTEKGATENPEEQISFIEANLFNK